MSLVSPSGDWIRCQEPAPPLSSSSHAAHQDHATDRVRQECEVWRVGGHGRLRVILRHHGQEQHREGQDEVVLVPVTLLLLRLTWRTEELEVPSSSVELGLSRVLELQLDSNSSRFEIKIRTSWKFGGSSAEE